MGSCLGHNMTQNAHTAVAKSILWRRRRDELDEEEAELVSNTKERQKRVNCIFRIINLKKKLNLSSQSLDQNWELPDPTCTQPANGNRPESLSDIQLQNLDITNLLDAASQNKESCLNDGLGGQNGIPTGSRTSSSVDLEWEHEYVCVAAQALYAPRANGSHAKNAAERSTTADTDSWPVLANKAEGPAIGPASRSLRPNLVERAATESCAFGRAQSRHQGLQGPGSITRNSSHNSWSHISTPESLEWDIDEDQQRQLRVEDDSLDSETLKLLHQIEQLKNKVLHETGEGLYEYEERLRDLSGAEDLQLTAKTVETNGGDHGSHYS